LPFIGQVGPLELVIILVIVIIIFGVGKLPTVGGALGKSIREFRSQARPEGYEDDEESEADDSVMASDIKSDDDEGSTSSKATSEKST
jgi:sec-independent protein translocase protein TatA